MSPTLVVANCVYHLGLALFLEDVIQLIVHVP